MIDVLLKYKSKLFLFVFTLSFILFGSTNLLEFYSGQSNADEMELKSEKKLKIEKKDRPDLFAKYMNGIRTEIGSRQTDYPANYRVKELLKATNRKSTSELINITNANSLNWKEIGPGNVSGRTRAIVVDPDDATYSTWFVGSVSGGIWKTTDRGNSWTELTSSLTNLATSVLVMAASDHNVMYAGTGEGFGNTDQIHGSGIWKTTDRGISWEQLTSTATLDFQNVTRLVIDPSNPDIVVVSTSSGWAGTSVSSGIWKTTDGGLSWTQKYVSNPSVEHLVANPLNFNTLYASVKGNGIIKSTNAGDTWFSASSGIVGAGRVEIAVAPSDTTKIYAAADMGSGESILYVSEDAGNTWNPSTDVSGDKDWLGEQGWYDNTIAVDPYDASTVYVGGINIFKLKLSPGTSTIGPQVTGVDQVNTSSFLAFVNFGGAYLGGGLELGVDFVGSSALTEDFTSVEVQFGPGKSQMAHRFTTPGGSGQKAPAYTYQDYVDVPFEVWDTDNNRQLMVSFRDEDNDGLWNHLDLTNAGDIGREYVFISAADYDSTNPADSIAQVGGVTYKNLYDFWPTLADGATFDAQNLPDSKLVINWGTIIQKNVTTTVITDAYGDFGGVSKGVHPDHHNLTIVKTDTSTQSFRLIDGNDGGVTYSDNQGTSWFKTLNGYNTSQFYGIDKKPNQNKYVGGTQDNGSFVSPVDPDDKSFWVSAPSGDGFEAAWNYGNANEVLESSQFNSINKSINGGLTWNVVDGIPTGSSDAPFITKIEASKLVPGLVFVVGGIQSEGFGTEHVNNALTTINGISRSTNFGDTWKAIRISAAGWSNTSSSTKIKISLADPSIVWAGRSLLASFPMSVSQDTGKTFTAIPGAANSPSAFLSGFATHPTDKNTAYALFSLANKPKILKTTDLGQTWTDISGFGTGTSSTNGFPDVAVFSLLVMPHNPKIIWAGTEIGLFESQDSGNTWHFANNGLPSVAVWEMKAFDDQVMIATHGRGVWTVPLSDIVTGVEQISSGIPETFELSQNYPNPFNPSTKINYQLPQSGVVTLNVFDVLGRKVATLVNEKQNVGKYNVTFNASSGNNHFASGIYFYRLNVRSDKGADFTLSKKMILLK